MKKYMFSISAIFILLIIASGSTEENEEPNMEHIDMTEEEDELDEENMDTEVVDINHSRVFIVPEDKGYLEQIEEGFKIAKDNGEIPVVYYSATWCTPCQELKSYMSDPAMKEAFEGVYVMEVDIDDFEAEEIAALGYSVSSIPAWIKLDENGEYSGDNITGGAWEENIPENMAGPLSDFFH